MEVTKIKQFNVVMLGLSFMLLFTGFMTMAGIQTLVFNSAKNPDSEGKIIFRIKLGGFSDGNKPILLEFPPYG